MSKKIKITISIILSIVIFFITTFVFVCQASFSILNTTQPTSQYYDIMRKANLQNDNFGDTPITEISMLGSHDALSYNINRHSKPNVNETTNYPNNKFIYTMARGLITRLSKAQNDDILTQLNNGVRYIDARVTYVDGDYYNSHGVISHKFSDSLTQILEFLDDNPGEFIILHIAYYYPGTSNDQELDNFIASIKYNNKNIFDYINYDIDTINSQQELTYNIMTDNGTKAGVLFVSNQENTTYSNYFKLSQIYSKWHNKTSSNDLITSLNALIPNIPSYATNILKVNQTQTTPNFENVWGVITGWSLLSMAEKHNVNMINNSNFDTWLSAMPIYMCDFTTSMYGNFNTIINQRILQYNLNL